MQALGQLFNALSNTAMILACTIPGEEWHDAREQVEKLGKTASESLGLETGETVSVFRPRHRNNDNKNLILGGPEVIPM